MRANEEPTVITNNGIPFLERSILNWFPSAPAAGQGTIYVQWRRPADRRQIRFRWDVTIADVASIERMNREQAGPADNGLAALDGEGWPWKAAVSGLTASAEADIKADNREIEKTLKKLAASTADGVPAKFEPTPDGRRIITIGPEGDARSDRVTVTAGAGVPIPLATEKPWKGRISKADPPEMTGDGVLESADEGRRLHVQWLRGLPVSGEARPNQESLPQSSVPREYYCTTSVDGKKFYLLSAQGLLVVFDATTMKAEAALQFQAKCTGVSLCSEGLLVAARDDINSLSGPVDSVLLRPARNSTGTGSHCLYLLDARSLKVKKNFGIPAEALVSHEESEVVFTGSPSGIAVLDLKQETVTDYFPLRNSVMAQPDESINLRSPFRLVCNPEQTTLVAIHEPIGQSQYLVFQTGNGTLRLVESGSNRNVQGVSAAVSPDASLLCLSNRDDRRRHFVIPGADTPLIPSIASIPFPTVIEPASRSLWSMYESGAVIKKWQLSVTQGRRTFDLVLEKTPRQMEWLGANRVLLIMENQLGIAEVKATADFWPFEANLRNEIPTEPTAGKANVSATPLTLVEERGKGLRVDSGTVSIIGWTPEGDAAILMEEDTTSSSSRITTRLRRLDWATRKETHCWTINTGRVVNRCQATGAGLLFFDENDRQYTLLSYRDLVPIWTIKSLSASGLSGHSRHTMLVGVSNGVFVMDALTRKIVARSGALNLAKTLNASVWDGQIQATNDPTVVAISHPLSPVGQSKEYHLFRVSPEGSFAPRTDTLNETALKGILSDVPVPEGYRYQLTGNLPREGRLEITNAEGKTLVAPFEKVSFVAPHPVNPGVYAVKSGDSVFFVTPE